MLIEMGELEKPHTIYNGEKFYMVGCRKCGESDWDIFTNQDVMIAKCLPCGHTVNINKVEIKKEKDY